MLNNEILDCAGTIHYLGWQNIPVKAWIVLAQIEQNNYFKK